MSGGPIELHLVVLEGPQEGQSIELRPGRSIRIGRSAGNDLVLADAMISRNHSRVERRDGDRVAVTDLGSRNGTIVGGTRVEALVVEPGQRIRLGSHVLVVRERPGDRQARPGAPAPVVGGALTGEFPLGSCQGCGSQIPIDVGPGSTLLLCPTCRSRDRATAEYARPATIDVGGRLGPFEILGRLGDGAVATTYRIRDSESGEARALKILRPELAAESAFVDRLAAEAIHLAALRHPNIARFYRIGREQAFVYLLVELVDGTSLRDRTDRTDELDLAEVVDIGRQVAGALEFAHGLGVCHRDVKPSNILIESSGRALLTDFALMRALAGAARAGRLEADPGRASAYFAAPEALDDPTAAGPAADQYGLAASLFYALTHHFPVPGASPTEIVENRRTQDPTPLALLRSDAPGDLSAAFARALARHPADRFPTVREFGAALGPSAGH